MQAEAETGQLSTPRRAMQFRTGEQEEEAAAAEMDYYADLNGPSRWK